MPRVRYLIVMTELHGTEEGTVPATFQIIYMVIYMLLNCNVADFLKDRVETIAQPTETSSQRERRYQLEGHLKLMFRDNSFILAGA